MKSKVVKVDLRKLNPQSEELTIEKLRELTGKPNMPEEEAKETILAIKLFVNIILQYRSLQDQIENDKDNLNIAA